MQVKEYYDKQLTFKFLKSVPETLRKTFLPAWAYPKKSSLHAKRRRSQFPLSNLVPADEPLNQNYWSFGKYWPLVSQKFPTIKSLYAALGNRKQGIQNTKEKFRTLIQSGKLKNPLHKAICSCASAYSEKGTYSIDPLLLASRTDGISGSYFLKNKSGEIRFVVKPLDEDAGCLNNPMGYASPFKSSPIRPSIPLYTSSLREALSYQMALAIGASTLVPRTTLAILKSEYFHDLGDEVSPTESSRYQEYCGAADREKLCSVQEYIPNTKTLFCALQELEAAGLSDEEIGSRFDSGNFEDANLFLWAAYDSSGYGTNFLVYVLRIDPIGNEIFGLKKINNGFAFPEKNDSLSNDLAYLPHANEPLSEAARKKMISIDSDRLIEPLKFLGLEASIPAFQERISLLKKWAQLPGITPKEIHIQLSRLQNSDCEAVKKS